MKDDLSFHLNKDKDTYEMSPEDAARSLQSELNQEELSLNNASEQPKVTLLVAPEKPVERPRSGADLGKIMGKTVWLILLCGTIFAGYKSYGLWAANEAKELELKQQAALLAETAAEKARETTRLEAEATRKQELELAKIRANVEIERLKTAHESASTVAKPPLPAGPDLDQLQRDRQEALETARRKQDKLAADRQLAELKALQEKQNAAAKAYTECERNKSELNRRLVAAQTLLSVAKNTEAAAMAKAEVTSGVPDVQVVGPNHPRDERNEGVRNDWYDRYHNNSNTGAGSGSLAFDAREAKAAAQETYRLASTARRQAEQTVATLLTQINAIQDQLAALEPGLPPNFLKPLFIKHKVILTKKDGTKVIGTNLLDNGTEYVIKTLQNETLKFAKDQIESVKTEAE